MKLILAVFLVAMVTVLVTSDISIIVLLYFWKNTFIFPCLISFDLDLLFRPLMPLNMQNFMKY